MTDDPLFVYLRLTRDCETQYDLGTIIREHTSMGWELVSFDRASPPIADQGLSFVPGFYTVQFRRPGNGPTADWADTLCPYPRDELTYG